MALQPFQQRVLDEHSELKDRLEKLTAFLETETFKNLEEDDRSLLEIQQMTMVNYEKVLGVRVNKILLLESRGNLN